VSEPERRPAAATPAHAGRAAGRTATPGPWSSSITATTERQVFIRGVALDEAIGRESFAAMLLRLWRGDEATTTEAHVMGACLVATLDHGPLSPSALVARTIASTRAAPIAALSGGILSFGEMHGAVVTRGMRILATAPEEGSLEDWADATFEEERAADRRLPGVGHRWHATDDRAERLIEVASAVARTRDIEAVRALATRLGRHVGHPVAVNVDGALAIALRGLRLDPEYGDFVFAIGRSFGLAAHIVEERTRERPMRLIDPKSARYDGVPIPESRPEKNA
jgi:citrate synthase